MQWACVWLNQSRPSVMGRTGASKNISLLSQVCKNVKPMLCSCIRMMMLYEAIERVAREAESASSDSLYGARQLKVKWQVHQNSTRCDYADYYATQTRLQL